ncbi:MAG: glycogen debranching enzyme N-terminal domain-containing protein [Candidatus Delongbacteria bacterium]|nr:glycogen debranching enzyme N-terminal domain-containing protein [Candidatus Delongbacteria bacterium]
MDFNYYFNEVTHHEWVLSNNKGGYSMGSGNFVNKRKYNGLLIASDDKFKRTHLIQSQEEKVRWRTREIYLDSSNYADCIYPDGYEHIVKTWLLPFPTILFSSVPKSDDFLILKKIKMHHSKNIVKVSFANLSSVKVEFEIRPKFSLRDHHSVNDIDIWDSVRTEASIDENICSVERKDTGVKAYFSTSKGVIEEERIIFRNIFYPLDSMRGYDASESVVAPVLWKFELTPGETAEILYSDEIINDHIRTSGTIDKRYPVSDLPYDHPDKIKTEYSLSKVKFSDEDLYPAKKYTNILDNIFDTFVTKDDIIAGFPWFSAWGRDTMISMKALLYEKNGIKKYFNILDKYGKKLQKGILPNVIGEGGQGTNYDSVDASLWFAVRLFDSYSLIEDEKLKKRLFSYLTEIVGNYAFNNLLPFGMNDDGLINIKYSDSALTWMDAKVYNKPVTPRFGKPVEINSLWYNALKTFQMFAKDMKISEFKPKNIKFNLKDINSIIKNIEKNANKFIVDGHLADRLENDIPIDDYRPNMLIAASLPFDLWSDEILYNSWKLAETELLTQYGIRTLSPRNSSFKKKFIGNQTQLDLSYHQGTVWAWLLGPFVNVFYKTHKKKLKRPELREQIDTYIEKFKLGILKGHISSVAEVWDGDNPHFPKGCPAQAWSVAALVEIENIFQKPGARK